jgi:DNA-binding MurR/RpiR family transcriptional regulator
MLKQLLPNVYSPTQGTDILYDDLVDLGKDDVLFCFSLGGPHHAKATSNAIMYAAQNSIPSVLVANSPSTPAAAHAVLTLYVPSASKHYSLVACMTLLESLIISIGKKTSSESKKKLRKLEKVLIDRDVTF